jgi:N-acetylmuramoyl-L-alanine amidase
VRISNGRLFFRLSLISSAIALLAGLPFLVSNAQSPQSAPGAPITTPPYPTIPPPQPPRTGLNIVVLDPAHGGTDPGARGAQGIRESDLLLDLTFQVRRALEAQGFQVLQTRSGNENPSFDDRSTLANAQRGAVFVTLHISSSGLPGTVRVYTMPDAFASVATGGVIGWDHAQAPYVTLSRRLGDAVQGQLAQRFKGSPNNSQSATIRQLRTTAAPAIADFRPSYVLPGEAGARP